MKLLSALVWASMILAAAGCRDEREPTEIVLRVTDWGSPVVESDFMRIEREILEGFEQQQHRAGRKVRVQKEQIPGPGQYAPKLTMMYVAGCAPDVVHLDASCGALFIDNGMLMDLAPLMARDPSFDRSIYFENVLNITRRGEAVYAVPLDFTPMMMYYNRKLFQQAGVPFPRNGWSWEDFLTTCKALTVMPPGAKMPTQYGFNFENVLPFWIPLLWTGGGDVLSPDGRRASGYLDGQATVEAVQFLADLILKHRVAPSIAERKILGGDAFLNGKAAMDLKGHWTLIDYHAPDRQLDVGVVGLPTRTGKPVTIIYVTGIAISRSTRHADLAWEYLKYMTSAQVQIKRVASGLAISGNREAADFYRARDDQDNPIEAEFHQAVEYARPAWGATVENFPMCEAFGQEMMEDILYGAATVPEATRRAAQYMDAVLAP
ncbi:MAG TPA: sugar ABC transporter substrate-binding protein [Phycisphaerae bacterium]|nr:sugar ABC transporter substrate-binding protein [Phycisphaerae bacterium]HRY70499.1 sugar ABC transporter substrate-binding protein [Phycisphaerae bacterium]HSA28228.1 sugar ABC transporter substrate-binding protein [Phycisphaerae bacterium]